MKRIFIGGIALLLLLPFLSCKKGEDDPGISFRSRKTRLAGSWILKSGSAAYTLNLSYNKTYIFDGSRLRLNQTSTSNVAIVYTGAYTMSLDVLKNGTFVMNEQFGSNKLKASGTWNFNKGIGDDKKKEDVVFFISSVSAGSTFDEHLFNRNCTNFEYRIKELKNKELVITSTGKYYSASNGSYVNYQTDYTFTQ